MEEQTSDYVRSYYAASANPAPERPPLAGEKSCDVCIVGAGYSGISTALHLAEAGLKVIVLEAAKVGWGASGRNGGKIVNGFSRGYDTTRLFYGEKTAEALLAMSFEGADIIRERVARYNIACDLKKTATFFAALNEKQMKELAEEKSLWESAGHNALELCNRDRLRDIVGSDLYCGGMLDYRGGHVHPLNLTLGQAAAIESLGGKIYELSPVVRLARKEKPEVYTENGKVTADYVVLCGGAYLGKVVPELASRTMPVSSKIITTEVLGEEMCRKLVPMDVGIEDCNFVLNYFRTTGDHRLLFGGGIHYGRPDSPKIVEQLRPLMLRTFPGLDKAKIEFSWGCAMSFTFTRLPHIGRLTDSIYFIQGFSGHGVAPAHLVGRVVGEAIAQQSSRLDVFANMKHYPFPGGRFFRVPLTVLGAWYYELRDRLGI